MRAMVDAICGHCHKKVGFGYVSGMKEYKCYRCGKMNSCAEIEKVLNEIRPARPPKSPPMQNDNIINPSLP